MEELLKQILNRLDSMEKDFNGRLDSMGKDIYGRFDSMEKNINNMEKDIREIKVDLKDVKQKVTAVYDQTADLTEFRTETRSELANISDKVDTVQMDVNNLTAKVAHSDNKILEFGKYIRNAK